MTIALDNTLQLFVNAQIASASMIPYSKKTEDWGRNYVDLW